MKIDHVHFYVEDAKAWRDWFVHYLNFEAVSDYVIPSNLPQQENLGRSFHTCTEVVKNGSVYFLLSSPILPTSPVAEFLENHPPGVIDVAFTVEDLKAVLTKAISQGAHVLQPLQEYQQSGTYIKWSKIKAWGSLTHTLIERATNITNKLSIGIGETTFTGIDHIVINVAAGDLERTVCWYENVFGFRRKQKFKIQSDRSSLHSQVLVSPYGYVQLPINEPASPNSQIQEFLEANGEAGIQHIALHCADILTAIPQFRTRGLSLLSVSQNYYQQLKTRLGIPLSVKELEAFSQQEILIDWNEEIPDALLLQIFTQPIFSKPTFFFEFIERRYQAEGFGENNFRALFEAMEQEQIKRSSL